MPDRETVLRGLECCVEGKEGCRPCPYSDHDMIEESPDFCQVVMLEDALKLLREQEPVEPEPTGIEPHYLCGKCGLPILNGDTYCKWCGRKVKWDGKG